MEQKTYRRGRFHTTSVMNEDFGNEYSQDYDTKNSTKKGNFESAQNPDYTEFNENYKKLLCHIEGWMTRLRNFHWASKGRMNLHTRLDEFRDKIDDYADSLAEECQGISGILKVTEIHAIDCEIYNLSELHSEILETVLEFYESIPESALFAGVRSQTDALITVINSYRYLFFDLCDF